MAVIREYTQRFNTPAIEVGGRRATADDFGGQTDQALLNFGREMQNTALIADRFEQEKQVSDAQVQMVKADAYAAQRMKELQAEAEPGEPIAERLQTEMSDYFGSLAGNYDRKGARNYVELYGAGMTQKIVKQARDFDVALVVDDKFNKRTEILEAEKRRVLADPTSYDDTKKRLTFEAEGGIGVWGVPDPTNPRVREASDHQVRKGLNEIAWSAAMGALQNPQSRAAFASVAAQANPSQSSVISDVIKREGGFVANDAGKGATKYGINKAANPDIDVANLTEAQAAKIYTERYWNKYGVGDLPQAVQPIVMDGVVNHGSAFAKQLSDAARNGATVEQLAQMRVAEYERLIATDPEKYGKYRNSWMNRVKETSAQIAPSPDAEISTKIDNAPSWYNDLTAEQQVKFLHMANQQAGRERQVADAKVRKTMQDHEAYIAQTGQLPPNVLPDSAFTDPAERQTYKSMLAAGRLVGEIISAPAATQQEMIAKLKPTYDPNSVEPGVYDKQVQIAQNAERMLATAMKLRQKDPILFAHQHNFSTDNPIKPIDKFDLDSVIPALTQRIPQAEAVAKQYGQPMKPLMDAEAQAMAQTVGRMGATDKMNYLKGLSGSLTMEQYNAVVKQVWSGNNPVQFVGKLMTNEGAVQNNSTAAQVAQTVLIGQQALEYKPAGAGGEAERGFKGVMPNFADVRQAVGEHLKGVKIPEAAVGNVAEVVMAHYVGTMLGKGVSKNLEITGSGNDGNATVFKDSLRTVLGNTSTVGTEKVLRPFGMDDTQFQSAVHKRVTAIDPALRGYGLTIRDGETATYDVVVGGVSRFQISLNAEPSTPAPAAPVTKTTTPRTVFPTTQSLSRYPWERQ